MCMWVFGCLQFRVRVLTTSATDGFLLGVSLAPCDLAVPSLELRNGFFVFAGALTLFAEDGTAGAATGTETQCMEGEERHNNIGQIEEAGNGASTGNDIFSKLWQPTPQLDISTGEKTDSFSGKVATGLVTGDVIGILYDRPKRQLHLIHGERDIGACRFNSGIQLPDSDYVPTLLFSNSSMYLELLM
eukprot:GHVT01078434.1.p1 GENE.GHVT01078434.1~~GHVT01078434.1.p1  ORF type:complete len:188 (-),score=19.13 GHVT01078434.1:192-755(-)